MNNFALSDAEDKNSRLLNRGGIADLPPLVRTPSAIQQTLQQSSFWELILFHLLPYASLAASKTLLQRLV